MAAQRFVTSNFFSMSTNLIIIFKVQIRCYFFCTFVCCFCWIRFVLCTGAHWLKTFNALRQSKMPHFNNWQHSDLGMSRQYIYTWNVVCCVCVCTTVYLVFLGRFFSYRIIFVHLPHQLETDAQMIAEIEIV